MSRFHSVPKFLSGTEVRAHQLQTPTVQQYEIESENLKNRSVGLLKLAN